MCICRCNGNRKDACCNPTACCQRILIVGGLAALCIGVMFFSIYEYYLKNTVLDSIAQLNWFVYYWFVYTRYPNLFVGILIPILMYKYIIKMQRINNCHIMGYDRKNPCCCYKNHTDYHRANMSSNESFEFEQLSTTTTNITTPTANSGLDINVNDVNSDYDDDISDSAVNISEKWCDCQINVKVFAPVFLTSFILIITESFIITDGVTLIMASENCRVAVFGEITSSNICGTITGSPVDTILLTYGLIELSVLFSPVALMFIPLFNKYCAARYHARTHHFIPAKNTTGLHPVTHAIDTELHSDVKPTTSTELHSVSPIIPVIAVNPTTGSHLLYNAIIPSAPEF